MILDLIVGVLLALVTGIIGLLPSFTLPGSMSDFGTGFGSSLSTLNGLFPVVTLGVCLAAVLGVRLFIAAFNLVVFVYKLIPLKFT